MVRELLEINNAEIEHIFALPEWLEKNATILSNSPCQTTEITNRELKKVSLLKTPNQALAIVKQIDRSFHPEDLNNGLSLYLDNIQNPGNMGTILRTADWFGIDWVICSPDSADLYNPKVVQASMSALFSVKVTRKDFSELSTKDLNLSVYGAILEGDNLFKQELTPTGLIVIGSEGRGIRPNIISQLDVPISIPSHPTTGTESLNAAIATAIICASFRNAPFFKKE